MILVLPLRDESKDDYIDLRYSLRSMEINCSNVEGIVVVSDKLPEWLTNVHWVRTKDFFIGNKEANIINKTLTANTFVKEDLGQSEFALINDDYIYRHKYDFNTVENCYTKMLVKHPPGKSLVYNREYYKCVRNTMDYLKAAGRTLYNFDGHYPHILETDRFTFLRDRFWILSQYIFKSLYFNINYTIEPGDALVHTDFKISKDHNENSLKMYVGPVYSVSDVKPEWLVKHLQQTYKKSSSYELR